MGGMPGAMGGRTGGSNPVPETVQTYVLKYRSPSDLCRLINQVLLVKVAADEERKLLLVQGTPVQISNVSDLIKQFDTPAPPRPPVKADSFQVRFFFLQCRSGMTAVSDEAIQKTMDILDGVRVKDTSVFRGPLRKAIQFFSNQGLNVFARWDRLEQEGISPDDESRLGPLEGMKNIPLRAALEYLLKAQSPEASLAYGIDPMGTVVISTANDVPGEYRPLPKFLMPAKEVLVGNGFDNPSLIGTVHFMVRNSGRPQASPEPTGFGNPMRGGMIRSAGMPGMGMGDPQPLPATDDGAFATSATSVINNDIPLTIRVEGKVYREPESGQVILNLAPLAVIVEGSNPPATTAPVMRRAPSSSPQQMLLDLRTTVVVKPEDYLVLTAVPTDPEFGRGIAVVIRVDEMEQKK